MGAAASDGAAQGRASSGRRGNTIVWSFLFYINCSHNRRDVIVGLCFFLYTEVIGGWMDGRRWSMVSHSKMPSAHEIILAVRFTLVGLIL
jgi:hypothetical protein